MLQVSSSTSIARLLAFTWLELVSPHSTYLDPVRTLLALYLGVGLVGVSLFGSRFLAAADPFEVYSTLVRHLSVWACCSAPARSRTVSCVAPGDAADGLLRGLRILRARRALVGQGSRRR